VTTQQDCSIGFSVAEASYGTITTPTKFVEFTEEDLSANITFLQGQGMRVGSRVPRNSRRSQGKKMGGGTVTLEAPSKGLGFLLNLAFGAVTTTQRATTGVYQQNHTPVTTDFLPSTTIQKGIPPLGGGAAVPHTFPGSVCNSIEFDCPNGEIVIVKAEFNSKDVDTATAYAAPGYPTPIELFTFVQGSLVIGGAPTAPTTTALATGGTSVADVRDFTLKWDNALDDGGFNIGGAGKRVRKPAVGDSALTGSLTAEFDATTLRDAYLSGTDLAFVATFIGASNIGSGSDHPNLQLYVPVIRLEGELPKSAGGQVITQSINFTGFDNLAAPPITVCYASTDTAP
jgi:hypothetical protein